MKNLTERLDQHLQSIRENDKDTLKAFLTKNRTGCYMADELLIAMSQDYFGYDYAEFEDSYNIVKSAFENKDFNQKYVNNVAKDTARGLKEAVPILSHPESLFSKEEIENGTLKKEVEKQAKEYHCKPEEIMINKDGGDDGYDELSTCTSWVIDMLELLEKINTPIAKKYIQAINSNPILRKAKDMELFNY